MRRSAIISILVFILAFTPGCSRHKIIPKKEMVDIYAEMFLADQWVMASRQRERAADTTMLYEPIFKRHGYTTADFRESVDYYLKDPERYTRLLKKTSAKLKARAESLKKQVDAMQDYKEMRRKFEQSFERYDPYYDQWLNDTLKLRDDERLIDHLDSLIRTALDPPVYFEPALPDTSSVKEPSETRHAWDTLTTIAAPEPDTMFRHRAMEHRRLLREKSAREIREDVEEMAKGDEEALQI